MSGSEDPYYEVIRAADRFADRTYERLARKVVHAMQRFPATGIFGDFYNRTLWDEFCQERHFGSHEGLDTAWDITVAPYIEQALASVSEHERDLLEHLNALDGNRTAADALRSALDQCAMAREFPPQSWPSTHG